MSPQERRRRAAAMSPEERRDAIVRSTLPLLREHGANVTTRQIAQAAGIAEGTIFRVFESKDELLRVCVLEGFRTDDLCAAIRQLPREGDLASQLTEAAMLFLDHFTRIGEMMRTLATTGYDVHRHKPPHDDQAHDVRAEFLENLSDAFASVLEPAAGQFRVPITDLVRMLLSLVMGMRFDPLYQDDDRAGIRKRVDVLLYGALTEPDRRSNDE